MPWCVLLSALCGWEMFFVALCHEMLVFEVQGVNASSHRIITCLGNTALRYMLYCMSTKIYFYWTLALLILVYFSIHRTPRIAKGLRLLKTKAVVSCSLSNFGVYVPIPLLGARPPKKKYVKPYMYHSCRPGRRHVHTLWQSFLGGAQ